MDTFAALLVVAIAASITTLLLFVIAGLFLYLYVVLINRPHYSSGAGRKLREDTENGTARTIPEQKDLEAEITVLDGTINNLTVVRDNKVKKLEGIKDTTSAAMRSLESWVRK